MSQKVSVIICSYNRAEYLSRAIASVLAQTYENFEIIVIDDASTDTTQEILKSYSGNSNIILLKNDQNLGISKSRNKGVSHASGTYIAMLDSDDFWIDSEKLERQVFLLNTDTKIGIVGSGIRCVRKDGAKIKDSLYHTNDIAIRNHILIRNQFAQSAVMFRKDVFLEAGPYDEKLALAEDLDLWLRIGKKYSFANLKEVMVGYTIHSSSESRSKKLQMALVIDMIIRKYRNNYPHYWKAKIVSLGRILKAWL